MKKFLVSLLVIILLFAITVGVLELSSTYTASQNVNKSAPVQTVQKIYINASPEKIYKIMTDVNQWSSWQPDIKQPLLNSKFDKGNSFSWKSGGLNIHSTIHTAIPNNKIGWSGPAFGCFAIHNWTFTQMIGYTEVSVEESMEGWLVKLMRKKFQGGLEQSLQIWMKNLKIEAEKL